MFTPPNIPDPYPDMYNMEHMRHINLLSDLQMMVQLMNPFSMWNIGFMGMFALQSPLQTISQSTMEASQLASMYSQMMMTGMREFGASFTGLPTLAKMFQQIFTTDAFELYEAMHNSMVVLKNVYASQTFAEQTIRQSIELARKVPLEMTDLLQVFSTFSVNPMIRGILTSRQQMEKLAENVSGLAFLVPEQGTRGAIFAIREALAGQFRSLQMRFNISPEIVAQSAGMNVEEIKENPKKFLTALNLFLRQNLGERTFAELKDTFTKQVGNIFDAMTSGIFEAFQQNSTYSNVTTMAKTISDLMSRQFSTDEFSNFFERFAGNISVGFTRAVGILNTIDFDTDTPDEVFNKLKWAVEQIFDKGFEGVGITLKDIDKRVEPLSKAIGTALTDALSKTMSVLLSQSLAIGLKSIYNIVGEGAENIPIIGKTLRQPLDVVGEYAINHPQQVLGGSIIASAIGIKKFHNILQNLQQYNIAFKELSEMISTPLEFGEKEIAGMFTEFQGKQRDQKNNITNRILKKRLENIFKSPEAEQRFTEFVSNVTKRYPELEKVYGKELGMLFPDVAEYQSQVRNISDRYSHLRGLSEERITRMAMEGEQNLYMGAFRRLERIGFIPYLGAVGALGIGLSTFRDIFTPQAHLTSKDQQSEYQKGKISLGETITKSITTVFTPDYEKQQGGTLDRVINTFSSVLDAYFISKSLQEISKSPQIVGRVVEKFPQFERIFQGIEWFGGRGLMRGLPILVGLGSYFLTPREVRPYEETFMSKLGHFLSTTGLVGIGLTPFVPYAGLVGGLLSLVGSGLEIFGRRTVPSGQLLDWQRRTLIESNREMREFLQKIYVTREFNFEKMQIEGKLPNILKAREYISMINTNQSHQIEMLYTSLRDMNKSLTPIDIKELRKKISVGVHEYIQTGRIGEIITGGKITREKLVKYFGISPELAQKIESEQLLSSIVYSEILNEFQGTEASYTYFVEDFLNKEVRKFIKEDKKLNTIYKEKIFNLHREYKKEMEEGATDILQIGRFEKEVGIKFDKAKKYLKEYLKQKYKIPESELDTVTEEVFSKLFDRNAVQRFLNYARKFAGRESDFMETRVLGWRKVAEAMKDFGATEVFQGVSQNIKMFTQTYEQILESSMLQSSASAVVEQRNREMGLRGTITEEGRTQLAYRGAMEIPQFMPIQTLMTVRHYRTQMFLNESLNILDKLKNIEPIPLTQSIKDFQVLGTYLNKYLLEVDKFINIQQKENEIKRETIYKEKQEKEKTNTLTKIMSTMPVLPEFINIFPESGVTPVTSVIKKIPPVPKEYTTQIKSKIISTGISATLEPIKPEHVAEPIEVIRMRQVMREQQTIEPTPPSAIKEETIDVFERVNKRIQVTQTALEMEKFYSATKEFFMAQQQEFETITDLYGMVGKGLSTIGIQGEIPMVPYAVVGGNVYKKFDIVAGVRIPNMRYIEAQRKAMEESILPQDTEVELKERTEKFSQAFNLVLDTVYRRSEAGYTSMADLMYIQKLQQIGAQFGVTFGREERTKMFEIGMNVLGQINESMEKQADVYSSPEVDRLQKVFDVISPFVGDTAEKSPLSEFSSEASTGAELLRKFSNALSGVITALNEFKNALSTTGTGKSEEEITER